MTLYSFTVQQFCYTYLSVVLFLLLFSRSSKCDESFNINIKKKKQIVFMSAMWCIIVYLCIALIRRTDVCSYNLNIRKKKERTMYCTIVFLCLRNRSIEIIVRCVCVPLLSVQCQSLGLK